MGGRGLYKAGAPEQKKLLSYNCVKEPKKLLSYNVTNFVIIIVNYKIGILSSSLILSSFKCGGGGLYKAGAPEQVCIRYSHSI